MEKELDKNRRLLFTMSQKHKLIATCVIIILIFTFLSGCQTPDDEKNSGEYEVAAEFVTDYTQVGKPNLPHTGDNVDGFVSALNEHEIWDIMFVEGDADAHEDHFKRPSQGGLDFAWVDAADFVYFAGHGCGDTGLGTGSCFTFGVDAHDDWILEAYIMNKEPQWGDNDLEWIVLDCCSALATQDGGAAYPLEIRWMNSEVMAGLHYIFGFASFAHDNEFRGGLFGENIVCPDCYPLNEGWRRATIYTEENFVDGAYLYAYSSGANPENDWLPPGWTSADPDPATQQYVHLEWPCG